MDGDTSNAWIMSLSRTPVAVLTECELAFGYEKRFFPYMNEGLQLKLLIVGQIDFIFNGGHD
ncbi:MAG: hypothetical protein ACXWFP_05225 [Methylobacter sp.]